MAAGQGSPTAKAGERALRNGVLADLCIILPFVSVALLSGSATAMTEAVRGVLQLLLDVFSLAVLLAINRRRFAHFEFGLEKLQILVQILLGFSMCLTLLFIGERILGHLAGEGGQPDYLFCLLFAALSYVNLLLNVGVLRGMLREQRRAPTLILAGQIKNRIVMLVSSLVATLSCAVVVIPDRVLFDTVDAVGAVLVFAVVVWMVSRLLGSGILALLDAPIDEWEKLGIYNEVVARFDEWEELVFLRTRRVGYQNYVEVGLTFDPAQPLERSLATCRRIEEAVLARPGKTLISVRPAASRLAAA